VSFRDGPVTWPEASFAHGSKTGAVLAGRATYASSAEAGLRSGVRVVEPELAATLHVGADARYLVVKAETKMAQHSAGQEAPSGRTLRPILFTGSHGGDTAGQTKAKGWRSAYALSSRLSGCGGK
jgi:hypothetical protein